MFLPPLSFQHWGYNEFISPPEEFFKMFLKLLCRTIKDKIEWCIALFAAIITIQCPPKFRIFSKIIFYQITIRTIGYDWWNMTIPTQENISLAQVSINNIERGIFKFPSTTSRQLMLRYNL